MCVPDLKKILYMSIGGKYASFKFTKLDTFYINGYCISEYKAYI